MLSGTKIIMAVGITARFDFASFENSHNAQFVKLSMFILGLAQEP